MTMNFYPLADNDVIQLDWTAHALFDGKACVIVEDLLKRARDYLKITNAESGRYNWIGKGIEASVLRHQMATEWQEGFVRICIEFSPLELYEKENLTCLALHGDDILRVPTGAEIGAPTLAKVSAFYNFFREKLGLQEVSYIKYYWLSRGVECKVLKGDGSSKGWQPGFVRLQLEFLPKNMPEVSESTSTGHSELDSLRQASN
ncbi:MAG: KGK domain-containing protein [Synechococcales bacterium]|nr:KGK domain-containing protein [Synechococcales bacterium]